MSHIRQRKSGRGAYARSYYSKWKAIKGADE